MNNFAWLEEHKFILDILSEDNEEARFVGGAVKNSLLNQDFHDFDIAATMLPEKIMQTLKRNKINVIPTGLQHGTVTAVMHGHSYEITTLRTDVQTYGRRADVEFTKNWIYDAERRDLTINAIYMDKNGKIFDYFEGVNDLSYGIIKFIGDPETRIQEDYLRILRFFRFFAAYGLKIDENGLEACKKYRYKLLSISIERITKEILTMLKYESPELAICFMHDIDLLSIIFAEQSSFLKNYCRMCINKFSTGDNISRISDNDFEKIKNDIRKENSEFRQNLFTFIEFLQFEKKSFSLISNAVSHKISSSNLLRLFLLTDNFSKLCLSNKQLKYINTLKSIYNQSSINFLNKIRTFLYKFRKIFDEDLVKFLINDTMLLMAFRENSNNAELLNMQNILFTEFQAPPDVFPINGEILLTLGIKEGKNMGDIMQNTMKYWLNSNCSASKEDCLSYVNNLI